ncbi:hypothetical protein B296_00006016 [Ensete ventricosum]|uniref:Uncharacterized protein n=1 Tax=Ensete ventricosum TaxID=4639 RepID=A0A426YMB9_ENSVE|nr:hypothetical protein B296_00006016 [Ensete ventricosum]
MLAGHFVQVPSMPCEGSPGPVLPPRKGLFTTAYSTADKSQELSRQRQDLSQRQATKSALLLDNSCLTSAEPALPSADASTNDLNAVRFRLKYHLCFLESVLRSGSAVKEKEIGRTALGALVQLPGFEFHYPFAFSSIAGSVGLYPVWGLLAVVKSLVSTSSSPAFEALGSLSLVLV